MYACDILKHSANPAGHQLVTFEITFPRFMLAELNTHRMLSRNSASSRAIPTEKQIARIMEDPFVPTFNKRVTGMGVGEAFTAREQTALEARWLAARDYAVKTAQLLLDVDKSRANRVLEPFMWHTAIVSATEWANFFALRDHPAAQPEFQTIARMMREALEASTPDKLDWGEWHLPLVFPEDKGMWRPQVSAGRCARVSYDRQHDSEPARESVARWNKLSSMGHWSPGEHPARCWTEDEWQLVLDRQDAELARAHQLDIAPEGVSDMEFVGNYKGFVQLRKLYPGEAVFSG